MQIPYFKCHKTVQAFPIGKIEGNTIHSLDGTIQVEVSPEFIDKFPLNREGYYVRYADGYESFSPVEAFEEGYKRIYETLEGHKVNPANDKLTITVCDRPGSGGAFHAYMVSGYEADNPASEFASKAYETLKPKMANFIFFQNGPIKEAGVNGITQEVLLEIIAHRLSCFQSGPFACEANAKALEHVLAAKEVLLARTRERMERGVEGTHKQ